MVGRFDEAMDEVFKNLENEEKTPGPSDETAVVVKVSLTSVVVAWVVGWIIEIAEDEVATSSEDEVCTTEAVESMVDMISAVPTDIVDDTG